MKYISYIINSIFILLMLAVAGLFLVPLLPIEHNLQLKIVESGSMEPQIMTGSLVAIWPTASYRNNEIITFKSQGSDIPTTHRIVETYEKAGKTWFVTKGDANEDVDASPVLESEIIGSVLLDLPYAGFILDFARQPLGFIFLILLPALLVILSEVEKIWSVLRNRKEPSDKNGDNTEQPTPPPDLTPNIAVRASGKLMMDISNPVRFLTPTIPTLDLRNVATNVHTPDRFHSYLPSSSFTIISLAIVFSATIIGSSFLGSTLSYFNDEETSVNNYLRASSLDFVVLPDGIQYSFEDGQLQADDDGALVTLVVPEPDSVNLRHNILVQVTGGNTLFCDAIVAESSPPVVYLGPITTLNATEIEFDSPWSLSLSLPDSTGFLNGEQCQLDIVITAWHDETIVDQGYFDEERIPLAFSLIAPEALSAGPSFLTTLTETVILSTTTTSLATTTDEVPGKKVEEINDVEVEEADTNKEDELVGEEPEETKEKMIEKVINIKEDEPSESPADEADAKTLNTTQSDDEAETEVKEEEPEEDNEPKSETN